MKCNICGNNNAKYKYYEVDSDRVKELNICKECARKRGITFDKNAPSKVIEKQKCYNCGMTFKEYKENNMLGCPLCYKSFRSKLDVILSQIHQGINHRGKKPVRDTRVMNVKKEIRELQKKLEEYVQKEKYEKAVELRDEIKKHEEKLKSLRGNNG